MYVTPIPWPLSIETDGYQEIDPPTRSAISRVTNIIQVFSSHFIPLTDTLLLEAYEWTVEQEGEAVNLLQEEFGDALVSFLTPAQG